MSRYDKKRNKHRQPKFVRRATKLLLNLVILAGSGMLIRYGYLLFTNEFDPLIGSIVFIAGITAWVLLIKLLRSRYKWTKPSFKLTTFSVIAILLIFTFAGVEPLDTYKDNLIESYKTAQAERAAQQKAEDKIVEWGEPQNEAENQELSLDDLSLPELEYVTFEVINMVRNDEGVPSTKWDDELYKLSKAHTQEMANRGECFHSYEYGKVPYGECCWGGEGYYTYSNEELVGVIVAGWMSSPLHRACLLHNPVKASVVTIVITPTGQYASWTFWWDEFGEGPELVRRAVRLWQAETGESIPWQDWLDSKGYPHNTEWVYEE